MTAKLIKGTEIREEILSEIEEEVKKIKDEHGVVPGLVTILVGENPASISYVTLKIKTANRLGFKEIQDNQPEDVSQEDLLALIETPVSDLTPLANLTNLKILELGQTQVTDLSPLANLTKLTWVDLSDTETTDEEVAKLQKAFPNCRIIRK